jgi:hypothetical protein
MGSVLINCPDANLAQDSYYRYIRATTLGRIRATRHRGGATGTNCRPYRSLPLHVAHDGREVSDHQGSFLRTDVPNHIAFQAVGIDFPIRAYQIKQFRPLVGVQPRAPASWAARKE